MYRFNSEHITDTIVKTRLISEAMKYDANEFNRFVSDLGWEDWMNDFTDAVDGEEITQSEADLIDGILLRIFNEAQDIKILNEQVGC